MLLGGLGAFALQSALRSVGRGSCPPGAVDRVAAAEVGVAPASASLRNPVGCPVGIVPPRRLDRLTVVVGPGGVEPSSMESTRLICQVASADCNNNSYNSIQLGPRTGSQCMHVVLGYVVDLGETRATFPRGAVGRPASQLLASSGR